MTDRYLEHAIACLNLAKDTPIDNGVYCKLSVPEVDMILDLLKEQEAVEPRECQYPHGTYACGFCDYIPIGNKDGYRANYCPECGRSVKWE